MVGLGSCNNTSDLAKPVSTATQTALDVHTGEIAALETKTTNQTYTAIGSITSFIGELLSSISFAANGTATFWGLSYFHSTVNFYNTVITNGNLFSTQIWTNIIGLNGGGNTMTLASNMTAGGSLKIGPTAQQSIVDSGGDWSMPNDLTVSGITKCDSVQPSSGAVNVNLYTNSNTGDILLGQNGGDATVMGNQITLGSVASPGTSASVFADGTIISAVNGTNSLTATNGNIDLSINTAGKGLHCKNHLAGVYLINGNALNIGGGIPIFYSGSLANCWGQAYVSGTTNYYAAAGTPVGSWASPNVVLIDDLYMIYPGYAAVGYGNGWVIYLNFKNKTNGPVLVRPSSPNSITVMDIYFDGKYLIK